MNKKIYLRKIISSIILICFISHGIISSSGNIIQKNNHINTFLNVDESSTIISPDSNAIVYSAHQSTNSRIVVINYDNTVINKYDYSNKNFLDLEVVDNEVYALEKTNSSVYRIDINNGNLELLMQDSNLINPYSLAFDGDYFYVVGQNINRYDTFGNYLGSAAFNQTVYGAAWDGVFYWILNDNNEIKCYDISNWPTISEGPFPTITPPSPICRGLYFDGVFFWSAEYKTTSVGNIYQFDYFGNIVKQLVEPYVIGWSAGTIAVPNIPPEKPDMPSGPEIGVTGVKYSYLTSSIDPDDHGQLYYKWDWGDGNTSSWEGPYNSSEFVYSSNAWSIGGLYELRVKSKDMYNAESEWSDPLLINISGEEHMNLIIGKISNLDSGSDYITFNADIIWWIILDSLELLRFRSGEQLSISHEYFGILNQNFVLCISF